MEMLIVFVATTVFSAVGWWIGDFVGLFSAVMLSIIGSAAGVYVGRKVAREYLP